MSGWPGLGGAWGFDCPQCDTHYVINAAVGEWIDFACQVCTWAGQVRFYPHATEATAKGEGHEQDPA